MILCIDPGTTCAGWAGFSKEDKALLRCGLVRGSDWIETAKNLPAFSECDTLIIEDPRIYPASKARANDIMKLAKSVGAFVASVDAAYTKLVTPATWKKSIPKLIHQKRIMRALTDSELAILNGCQCPKSLLHNTVDAVGIGLWYVRRYRA